MSQIAIAAPGRAARRTLRGVLTGLVVAAVAVFGAVAASPAPAEAATLATKVDNFVKQHPAGSKVGTGQCVALIHAYDKQVLGWSETGTPGDTGAHEWWDAFGSKAGLSAHYTKVSKTAKARKGDVAVYSTAVGGGYGHIAIVLTDNGGSLKVMQQNWTKSLHVTVDKKMTKSHLLGYLRPKG